MDYSNLDYSNPDNHALTWESESNEKAFDKIRIKAEKNGWEVLDHNDDHTCFTKTLPDGESVFLHIVTETSEIVGKQKI